MVYYLLSLVINLAMIQNSHAPCVSSRMTKVIVSISVPQPCWLALFPTVKKRTNVSAQFKNASRARYAWQLTWHFEPAYHPSINWMTGSVNNQSPQPTRPVCQQSWLQGLLPRRTRRFFHGNCPLLTFACSWRDGQAELTWMSWSNEAQLHSTCHVTH